MLICEVASHSHGTIILLVTVIVSLCAILPWQQLVLCLITDLSLSCLETLALC